VLGHLVPVPMWIYGVPIGIGSAVSFVQFPVCLLALSRAVVGLFAPGADTRSFFLTICARASHVDCVSDEVTTEFLSVTKLVRSSSSANDNDLHVL